MHEDIAAEGRPHSHPALDFGIYLPQVGFTYPELRERATRCEVLGFGSVWLYDHLSAPGLPEMPSFEAWTLATALATSTSRIRVGHLVLCNSFRHPAVLAKMATTLDVVSGGRLDLGIGSGSWRAEHDQAGLPWGSLAERTERLGDTLEILHRSWGDQPATYTGRHYQIRELWNVPQPLQRPHPPIVIGGVGPRSTLPLAARYADVWNLPTYGLSDVDGTLRDLTQACETVGRDPASLRRSVEAVVVIGEDAQDLRRQRERAQRRYGTAGFGLEAGGFVGPPDQVLDRIGQFVARGFSHFVFLTADRAGETSLSLLAEHVVSRAAELGA